MRERTAAMTMSVVSMAYRAGSPQRSVGGFSLIELMIALVLGLLLSVGIVSLFSGTSKTNRVQTGLARLQENGRYAMTRIQDDLRNLGGQFRSNTVGSGFVQTASGPVYPLSAPRVNATGFTFPDGTAGAAPSGWSTTKAYPLSPRDFIQGYDCTSGTCSPAVPTGFPATGTSANQRVPRTDVLTVRYQRGTGWPYTVSGTGATTVITLTPNWRGRDPASAPPDPLPAPSVANCHDGPDDCLNIQTGDLVLLSDCGGSTIFQVTVSGTFTLKPLNLREAAQLQPGAATDSCDPRVFNFSRDLVTVSYWIKLVADETVSGRLIPALMRRENGVDQEVVRGVDRLEFLYGVQYANGSVRYLTAKDLTDNSTAANCPVAPPGVTTLEAGCLWRSLLSVEVHALMNTVDNINDLSSVDQAFRFRTTTPTPPGATLVTGVSAGKMMRREFIALTSVRNFTS